MDSIKILQAGEQGLVVEFGDKIDSAVNNRVHQVSKLLLDACLKGVIEIVPTYRSLMVYFDPFEVTRQVLVDHILTLLPNGEEVTALAMKAKVIEIPVSYGGEFGPDLGFVALHTGIPAAEVVEIHTSVPYLVYMLGFTPGFPYLGGMSERIATPRLEKPRTAIPAGSVGIAGNQTGFYPIESPGGWQIIGRTPVKGFDPTADNPFLFSAGDYLRFRAISPEEFAAISNQVTAGTYQPLICIFSEKDGAGL